MFCKEIKQNVAMANVRKKYYFVGTTPNRRNMHIDKLTFLVSYRHVCKMA
jgi:hypothetical protein